MHDGSRQANLEGRAWDGLSPTEKNSSCHWGCGTLSFCSMLLFGRLEMFLPGGRTKTSKQANGNLYGSESSENEESHRLLYKTAAAWALWETGGACSSCAAWPMVRWAFDDRAVSESPILLWAPFIPHLCSGVTQYTQLFTKQARLGWNYYSLCHSCSLRWTNTCVFCW